MPFCSLTKGITLKICWFCLVLINSVLLNLLKFYLFGSCFRILSVILVSDFLIFSYFYTVHFIAMCGLIVVIGGMGGGAFLFFSDHWTHQVFL